MGFLIGLVLGQSTNSTMAGCRRVPICRSSVLTTTWLVSTEDLLLSQKAAMTTAAMPRPAAKSSMTTTRMFLIFCLSQGCYPIDLYRWAKLPAPMAKA
jgi:hypothetical protein